MGASSDSDHSKNDEEAKRERRRAANRRSARKSRYREMVMLEELQKSVHELTVKNNALRQENDALRRGISAVKNFRQEQKLPSSLVSPCRLKFYALSHSCLSNQSRISCFCLNAGIRYSLQPVHLAHADTRCSASSRTICGSFSSSPWSRSSECVRKFDWINGSRSGNERYSHKRAARFCRKYSSQLPSIAEWR